MVSGCEGEGCFVMNVIGDVSSTKALSFSDRRSSFLVSPERGLRSCSGYLFDALVGCIVLVHLAQNCRQLFNGNGKHW